MQHRTFHGSELAYSFHFVLNNWIFIPRCQQVSAELRQTPPRNVKEGSEDEQC